MILGLSPSVTFIVGDIMSSWQRFGPIIEREAAKLTLAGLPPRILPNHEVEIAWLRGAAALMLQRRHILSPIQEA